MAIDARHRPPISRTELLVKLALLGREDRETYRVVRALMWELVVENSERSEFPRNLS